jgi:DNA transposition AAA+ family ATPase
VAREVLGVLRRCDVQRVLGMVDGVSGSGKSFALAQYCLGEPGTIVILGTPLSSPRSAIVALANAIGVDDQGSGDVILRKCADALRGTSRLLVLDEADHVSLPVLQTLRIARDAAGIGMVVICTSELLDKLRRRRSGSVEQILSRIAYSCHCAGITDDDAELILSPFGLDRAALRVACASQMHRGSARRVANAYVAAMESVNGSGRKLTALDFQRAYSALMSA